MKKLKENLCKENMTMKECVIQSFVFMKKVAIKEKLLFGLMIFTGILSILFITTPFVMILLPMTTVISTLILKKVILYMENDKKEILKNVITGGLLLHYLLVIFLFGFPYLIQPYIIRNIGFKKASDYNNIVVKKNRIKLIIPILITYITAFIIMTATIIINRNTAPTILIISLGIEWSLLTFFTNTLLFITYLNVEYINKEMITKIEKYNTSNLKRNKPYGNIQTKSEFENNLKTTFNQRYKKRFIGRALGGGIGLMIGGLAIGNIPFIVAGMFVAIISGLYFMKNKKN